MKSNTHSALNGLVRLLLLGVAGCAVGPDYEQPVLDLPAGWEQAPQQAAAFEDQTETLRTWWTVLDDSKLERYITQVTQDNPDLRVACLRIEEAQAQRDSDARRYYPRMDFNGSYKKTPTTKVGNSR